MISRNFRNKLTFEQFRDIIANRLTELTGGSSMTCPICGTIDGKWACIGYAELSSEHWDTPDIGSFLVFPVICLNCGFVAQFAVEQYDV